MTDYDEDYDLDEEDGGGDSSGSYSSPAWLLKGITGSTPGYLELENERLSYFLFEGGRRRRVFDVPLSEVKEVVFPWYYFGGGVKFRVGSDKYRLSFVQPNNAPGHPDLSGGLDAGKAWKSLIKK